MSAAIRLALSNFTVTFFVIGLLASGIVLLSRAKAARAPRDPRSAVFLFSAFLDRRELLLQFYHAHVFRGHVGALHRLGGQPVPGRSRLRKSWLCGCRLSRLPQQLWIAARRCRRPSLFLLGAAAGHLYQIAKTHNFAPGNSGAVLYSDILIPVAGFVLLWLQSRIKPEDAAR